MQNLAIPWVCKPLPHKIDIVFVFLETWWCLTLVIILKQWVVGNRCRRRTGISLQGNCKYLSKVITKCLREDRPASSDRGEGVLLLAMEVQWSFGGLSTQVQWNPPKWSQFSGSQSFPINTHERPSDSVSSDYLLIINLQDQMAFIVRMYQPCSYMK